jgi:alpha-tubulin suppressor-like RCC1 family protein
MSSETGRRVSYFVKTRMSLAMVWMCLVTVGLLLGTAIVGGCHRGRAQVSAGHDHTCALRPNGTILCWGNNDSAQSTPPAGKFTQVSAGQSYTCAIKSDQSVTCWGNNALGQSTPPAGKFTHVSAGFSHTCGVKTDGSVACWGNNIFGEGTPPSGTFIQVSVGSGHTCGLHPDNSVVCWGANALGQSTAPAGSFSQVSAGAVHTCGLKTDGTVACWGKLEEEDVKEFGIPAWLKNGPNTPKIKTAPGPHLAKKLAEEQAKNAGILGVLKMNEGSHLASVFGDSEAASAPSNSTPTGSFSQVNAGTNHTCGIRIGGSVVCWRHNSSGESTAPAGTFTQVSAGFSHACGVKTDGTVACWGSNRHGESTPPASAL